MDKTRQRPPQKRRPSRASLKPARVARRLLKPVKSERRRPPHRCEDERVTARRKKAFELRVRGHTYADIARALHCSEGTACEDITAELFDLRTKTRQDVEAVREMELSRCDLVIKSQWPKALKGDNRCALAIIRAMDHRAKLLGLYAPTEVKVEGGMTVDVFAIARREIESGLARLAQSNGPAVVPGQPQP